MSFSRFELKSIRFQAVRQGSKGALSNSGYYDPGRIEVMLKSQLAELYGIVANYNRCFASSSHGRYGVNI